MKVINKNDPSLRGIGLKATGTGKKAPKKDTPIEDINSTLKAIEITLREGKKPDETLNKVISIIVQNMDSQAKMIESGFSQLSDTIKKIKIPKENKVKNLDLTADVERTSNGNAKTYHIKGTVG
jgi:hypothetical protein